MTAKNNHPELIEKLVEGISNLTSSEEWQHYLTFQSKFHRYSFNNVLLIAAQCHEATQVAGFNAWRKMNRFVRKGEKAIWILAPMVYKNTDAEDGADEKVIRGFKFVPVFDSPRPTAKSCPPSATGSTATTLPGTTPRSSASPGPSASRSRTTSSMAPRTATARTASTASGSSPGTPPPSG
jgi:hypothetical protein